jgi:uncharacterized damage-inducible protein DinB
MTTPVPAIYRHHRWSWLTLFDALESLPADALTLTTPGTYGTVHQTLIHLIMNQRRFVEAITSSRPVSLEPMPDPMPPLAELRATFEQDAADLLAAAATVSAESVVETQFRGQTFQIPTIVPLFQSYNHGIEHRTDVTTILAAHGHEMPAVHWWVYNDIGMP